MSATQLHRLPSFVIIGAVKAATTWTGNQLRAQPSLFLPTAEPHYFSTSFDRGIGWYRSLFATAGLDQLIGEKSADYLADPNAAQRMAATIPTVRLVAQLRNPIERAYSDYCMLFRRGSVDGSIDRHLGVGGPQPRFLRDGLYRQHLARFSDHFPADQLHVVLYDDIRQKPDTTLKAIGKHIGAFAPMMVVAPEARANDSRARMLPLAWRRALRPLKGAVAPVRNRQWFKTVHSSLARPIAYPPLTGELQLRLRDYYAADVEALGKVLKRDLSQWLATSADPGETNR